MGVKRQVPWNIFVSAVVNRLTRWCLNQYSFLWTWGSLHDETTDGVHTASPVLIPCQRRENSKNKSGSSSELVKQQKHLLSHPSYSLPRTSLSAVFLPYRYIMVFTSQLFGYLVQICSLKTFQLSAIWIVVWPDYTRNCLRIIHSFQIHYICF